MLEIANEPQFRLAVNTVEIEAHGAFLTAYETSHLQLISHGIIRESLTEVLQRLPNFSTLRLPEEIFSEPEQLLGRSNIDPGFMVRRDSDEIEESGGCLPSDIGFAYKSYVLCDLLNVALRAPNTLKVLDLYRGWLELGPLAEYLLHIGPAC